MKSNTRKAVIFSIGFFLFIILFIFTALMLNLLSNAIEIRHRGVSDREAAANTQGPIYLIDPGHGGMDGGAVGYSGILEKEINLAVSLKLGALLDAVGCSVRYTRTEDKMVEGTEGKTAKVRDIRQRVATANESGGFLISIHMNSYPASKYRGLQVFYADNKTDSDIMANNIQNYVISHLQNDNTRMAKPSPKSVYLTSHITCPGVIVECGFISNPEEEALLSTGEYQNVLAAAICCGILE
ncbi:MAG: N-acetylmuramoyl-L-alanine amidase [Clostridia bacterium]|nr:N-acetylmuramoyl-L-alanine amidase [Clostridia bacterium]